MIAPRLFKPAIMIGALIVYAILFSYHDRLDKSRINLLAPAMPEVIYKASLGFLEQIGAESLFVRTKVFFADLVPRDQIRNSFTFADYFQIISSLHPEFTDTYHFAESILPWAGEEQTRLDNQILTRGIQAHPNDFMLSFYLGFNHFYFLKEYKLAATYFLNAAEKKEAPSWLGHLAAVLSARGGDIIGGLVMLRAMERSETTDAVKIRYQKDISEYEKAAKVQHALHMYTSKYHEFPVSLHNLTPEFLPSLPTFTGEYRLIYTPPELRMIKHDEK